MASTKRYFGLSWVVCLILAILPTNIICGIITRAQRGNILGVILITFETHAPSFSFSLLKCQLDEYTKLPYKQVFLFFM